MTYLLLMISMTLHCHKKHTADIIIFTFDRPLQLYALLESITTYMTDINSINIIVRASNDRYKNAFNHVNNQFPNALFMYQEGIDDFKQLTLQALENSSSNYVLFAVDDNVVKDTISLAECIEWLEKTNSYGFYLKLGTHLDYCYTENKPQAVPPHTQIHEKIYTWNFNLGEKDWHYPNTVDMTLYRKADLVELFHHFEYYNPNLLEGKWAAWWVQHKAPSDYGVFYAQSKILNIPLNKVQTIDILNRDMNLYTPEELLELFEKGYKMDIAPLYQFNNKAVHTEYEPTFIPR